ncbi:MAG: hypothetical protein L0H70_02020 [Xanthomonadales bacterium]|nr:hypothetical protein [Xanthomonadales bacterium]
MITKTTRQVIGEDAHVSPHCAVSWPYNLKKDADGWRKAEVLDALTGAEAIAELLMADDRFIGYRADSDTPDEEPKPFDERTRFGLSCALRVVLRTAIDAQG